MTGIKILVMSQKNFEKMISTLYFQDSLGLHVQIVLCRPIRKVLIMQL